MKRTIFVYALFGRNAAALGAQQASQSNPYEGTSNPPPDDTITTPRARPRLSPSHRPAMPWPRNPPRRRSRRSASRARALRSAAIPPSRCPRKCAARPAWPTALTTASCRLRPTPPQPALNQRAAMSDPDGDIVHPGPLPPGELGEGAVIRVRLLDGLSTADSRDRRKVPFARRL